MKATSSHDAWRSFFLEDGFFFPPANKTHPNGWLIFCLEGFWCSVTTKCVQLLSPSNESTQTHTHTRSDTNIWLWPRTEVGKQTMTKPDTGASSWEQVLATTPWEVTGGAVHSIPAAVRRMGEGRKWGGHPCVKRLWKQQRFSILRKWGGSGAKSPPETIILKWWCNADFGEGRDGRQIKN